ncbi:hypothetical protein JCM10213v2_005149 [Rhodosporidiobolus nylandii]
MSQRTKSTVRTAIGARPDYCELSSEDSDDEMVEVGAKSRSGGKGSRGRGGCGKVGEEGESSDDGEWTAKKRRKTRAEGKGKAKKQRKKADLLQTMPLDILVEVFSYLHPGELLSLSYTAKPYYALLTSKTAAPIWRRSRRCLELPDLDFDGFSEIRYAQLVFHDRCELCDGKNEVQRDFYLRRRFCRQCRRNNYVKVRHVRKTHPHLHPLVAQVVLTTDHSPTAKWWGETHYALLGDLETYSAHLCELENEDDGDIEVRKLQSARRSREAAGAGSEESVVLSRVELFVKEREGVVQKSRLGNSWWLRHQLWRDADRLRASQDQLKRLKGRTLDEVEVEESAAKSQGSVSRYAWESGLESRLRDEGFSSKTFWQTPWTNSTVYQNPRVMTDEVWEEVKPQALEAARLADIAWKQLEGERRAREARYRLQNARIKHVRRRFDRLRAEEDDEFLRSSFPIFPVFLAFESVKPLLLSAKPEEDEDANLSDEAWDEALPLISEEISQYRLDLLLHAIKLILSATSDDPLPDDDDILEHLDRYDNAFFNRATSFLCCSIPGCHQQYNSREDRRPNEPGRAIFFGPLPALLYHQHTCHLRENLYLRNEDCYSRKPKALSPVTFNLPLEVACAVSALIELGNLDDETAGAEDFDQMDKRGRYEWEDSQVWAKRFSGWRALLDAIYRASTKAARSGPDHCLPPPSIVYYPDPVYSPSPSPSPSPAFPHGDDAKMDVDEEYEGEDELDDD